MGVQHDGPEEPGGQKLIDTLVELSGLSTDAVNGQLSEILGTDRHSSSDLTLAQLRLALAAHLEKLIEEEEQTAALLIDSVSPESSD